MLQGIPIGILAPAGLAGLAVLLIFTGRLVPRRTYDDVVHDRNERLADNRILMQHNADLIDQNNVLLREIAPTMNSILGAVNQVAGDARGGGRS